MRFEPCADGTRAPTDGNCPERETGNDPEEASTYSSRTFEYRPVMVTYLFMGAKDKVIGCQPFAFYFPCMPRAARSPGNRS